MVAPHTAPVILRLPTGKVEEIAAATIRFAGDASDGMHLVGLQFRHASAVHGNYVCSLPDLPAEIRAPAGMLAGVSAFQIHFSTKPIHTPGGPLNTLLAMNPAALKTHLNDLEPDGILVVNRDAFTPEDLANVGYANNPLEDGTLKGCRLLAVPMNQLNRDAVARVNLSPREAERCKSFFALGLAFWLYDRPLDPTLRWIRDTYAKNPAMVEANTRTLKAGYHFGETSDVLPAHYRVAKAEMPAGRYRAVTGIEALALGLLAAAEQTQLPLVFAGFPVRPANELLHQMFEWKQANVKVMQAEDDLAAINLAIGAAFGGALGVTATSGPGMPLQAESLSLAVMAELPCVVIDLQRAGPSAGMPTKTEQADLLHALHGRNGESPLIVLAPATPSDGFTMVLEAVRLALHCMSPVIVLADTYLAHTAETWLVPNLKEVPVIRAPQAEPIGSNDSSVFLPYRRNAHLARVWAAPGTPGGEHRTGGLEKEDQTGNVSYDPLNHERMVQLRANKIALAADTIPLLSVNGPTQGDLLVIGWGSTYGAIAAAVEHSRAAGLQVAHAHLRHLHPLPRNLGEVLKSYRKVLVPELNAGQLSQVLRGTYLVDALSLSKIQGQPFLVGEIERKIKELVLG